MNILVLMAGPRDAFQKAGYHYPKALIEIGGQLAIDHLARSLAPVIGKAAKVIFVVNREDNISFHLGDVLRLAVPNCHVIQTAGFTKGGACSALLAVDEIDSTEPLIVTNGDQIIDADTSAIVNGFAAQDLDGGIIVFRGLHPRWSFVRTGANGLVVEVAEKKPLSRLATAGFYYFSQGSDFVRGAKQMIRKDDNVDGSYFVCPVYNQLILGGAKIGVREIPNSQYHSLASPSLLESYEASLTLKH